MALITKSDFKGNVKISQNTKETADLTLYIERNQKNLLQDLLGDNQYYIYSLPNQASTTKYYALTNGKGASGEQIFYYNSSGDRIIYWGIIDALKYFTYWDYVRNLNAKATSVGIRFAEAENSSGSDQLQVNSVIEQRYNLGVENYHEACNFLNAMYDAKVHIKTISEDPLTAGEYNFSVVVEYQKNSVNLCSLINVGDMIDIGGEDYEVGSVTFASQDECEIMFYAPTGKTFTETHMHINPFLDYETKHKSISVLDGFL